MLAKNYQISGVSKIKAKMCAALTFLDHAVTAVYIRNAKIISNT